MPLCRGGKGEVWHEGQTEEMQEDGSLVLNLPASHEQEIMMEILKHGSHVMVLEPEWLRGKMAEELQVASRMYPFTKGEVQQKA